MAPKWLMVVECIVCGYAEQRDNSCPGWDRTNSSRVYHATLKSTKFKTYELSISEIFHFIFLDGSWPKVTEAIDK